MSKAFSASLLILSCFFGAYSPALAAGAVPAKPPYTRLFYFKDNATARVSLFSNPWSIDILAPQAYKFDVNGNLQGSIDPAILSFADRAHIKVMPVVTNGNFDQVSLSVIFSTTTRQTIAINALVAEAQKYGYYGWQIDFEQINVSSRDAYSAFVAKLATALHAHGLQLSVAVVAKTSDTPTDYPGSLWTNLIGAYDYKALASSTDFVTIMAYDDPLSRGPIAPYPWIQQVVAYSLRMIPPNKLSLGIPLYYWKWNSTTNKLVSIGGYAGIASAYVKAGAVFGYDPIQEEPFINYSADTSIYTIWYENSRSVAQKVALIKTDHLQGFSGWLLGLEQPDIFSAINQ